MENQNKLPNGINIAGMVCGICSLVLCWLPILGLGLGITGIILSAKGMKACNEGAASGKGMGIAGLVTGILGTLWSLWVTFWWIYVLAVFGSYY
tara:strand:+ start:645 stop:926 length:282 start_codon:yes stop_codon:yes gene_type:complete